MLAMTCEKCRRRFTPAIEEIQGVLQRDQGKRYSLILCPHCGKANKVAIERLEQAQRETPA
jgi:RNase P subunit RPR2